MEGIGVAEHDGAFDGMLQFAHVSRPGIPLQLAPCVACDLPDVLLVFPCVRPQEMVGQQLDVLAAFAQGRDVDFHRVDAVEQVLPERTLRHLRVQVGVGGAYQAHALSGSGGARRSLTMRLFSKAVSSLLWAVGGEVAHFVEEERTPVGQFQPSFFLCGHR